MSILRWSLFQWFLKLMFRSLLEQIKNIMAMMQCTYISDISAAVRASVTENANVSVNRCFQEVGVLRMTTWKILKNNFSLPYTIVLTQTIWSS